MRPHHRRLEAAAHAAAPGQAVSSQEPPLAVALYRATGRAAATPIRRQSIGSRQSEPQTGSAVGRGIAVQCILRLHALLRAGAELARRVGVAGRDWTAAPFLCA
jgi:hypothetical protein